MCLRHMQPMRRVVCLLVVMVAVCCSLAGASATLLLEEPYGTMALFLRDRYRRMYLEDVAPDAKDGGIPRGNWYQLVGSSYDRTIYGFEIETTPAQDDALISKLNSSSNRSHFHLVSNNCADFAKGIFNFYYPKSLHRSIVADAGMTTPKQMAKMLTKFAERHPELHFSRLIISQVPGRPDA